MNAESLAQQSNGFVYGAMVVLALAMFAYAAELAFGARGRVSRSVAAARVETQAQLVAVGTPTNPGTAQDAFGGEDGPDTGPTVEPAGAFHRDRFSGIAVSLTVLGTLLLFAGVVFRGFAARRAPWGNMYEFSITSALVVLVVFLTVARRRPALRYLGVFVVVPVLLTLGLAISVLYVPAGPLVPALKSYWLVIHVAAAIVSGGAFTIGGVITVLYLAQDHWERRGAVNALSSRLPPSEQLDQSAYRLFAFVFPLWSFAIMAGAIWAENAWGRYWGWDPKETWAFVTWVVFACYLHARATGGWKGRRAAMIALLGLGCFIFNYFGVNIWFTGLHSYGGLPNR